MYSLTTHFSKYSIFADGVTSTLGITEDGTSSHTHADDGGTSSFHFPLIYLYTFTARMVPQLQTC
jgi:hypothetical protein